MSAPPELPEIVSRAFDVSRKAGYVGFCRNETGRLLAALATTRGGTMAEFGTGCGVGTAWLRSGVRNGARIVTAELDPRMAGQQPAVVLHVVLEGRPQAPHRDHRDPHQRLRYYARVRGRRAPRDASRQDLAVDGLGGGRHGGGCLGLVRIVADRRHGLRSRRGGPGPVHR